MVSTDVGGGLVVGGHVYPGPTGNAGHIGHTSVDLDGESCPCGSRGCVEILASGSAIVRHALRNGWRPDPGDEQSAVEVARAALSRYAMPFARTVILEPARLGVDAGLTAAALGFQGLKAQTAPQLEDV
jgi:glucokinase